MTGENSKSIRPLLAMALLLAGCANRTIKPSETWIGLNSEQRQKRLQLAPAYDSRILRYNHGQFEFVERSPRIRKTAAGAAPEVPIVYVHGLGGNMGDFGPLLLAEDTERTVVAVNLPGTGRSTSQNNEFTINAQADALHELLIRRMDFRKVDLVCHSLGGQVCMAFGLEHPANVSSLTLIDAAGSYDQGEFAQRMAKRFGKVNLGSISVASHPAISILTGGDQSLVNRLVSDDPTVIAALDSFNQTYRNHIRNLTVPVLLIWGENDPIFPIQNGFFLLSNIRDIRMKVAPDAGHLPQLTNPDLVGGWIRAFHQSLATTHP